MNHDQVALNGFVAIAASRNGDPPPPVAGESPFVLARLTETGFWPATREDLEVGATESPPPAAKAAISQRNGVVDLGASFQPAEGPIRRRFALTTLDPGLEAERMWRARNATPGSGAETARSTRGFVLIDSWRNAAVSAAHAWNTGKGANPDFLDADDLTVGYRLDVALRRGDGTTEWRSLHQREISYFHPDDSRDGRHPEPGKDRLKPWLERIGLGYESDRRRDLDEGWLVPAVRRRREAGNVEYLHAEEVLATWAGEPLGMSCGGEPVTLKPGSELQIPRRYRLPDEDSEDAFKIPPLRFGWSYRFGLRPVWQGGVSVSIREAGAAYATEVAGRDMAFPPALDSRARYRRFLRHEPVLKPVVLLSEREIADEQKPGSPMLARQSANVAVLRSVQGKPTDKRAHPDTTTRYILPPECTYETALRHGLFDDETRAKDGTAYADSTPAGAFLDLAFDESWGGFPLHSVPEKRELPRTLLRTGAANGKLPPQEKAEPVFRAEPGRAAEKARSRAEKLRQRRPGPYFADPAARKLVIALRPSAAASGTGYFPGTPIVVDFGDEGVPLPVELRIEKAKEHPRFGQITEQKDFWSSSKPALSRAAGIKVQSVTLRLPPGASVAVDLWYAPADAQLRQLFDLPESIAIVSGTTHGTALADLVPLPDGVSPGQWPKSGESWAGEGECTVSAAAVGKAAARLSARLARLPVPAISGVETLMATHAIDRPMAPAWPKEPKLATRRVPAEDKDNAIRIEALKRLAGEAATKSDASDRPGQTGFVLGGIAEFDRDTASRLLIEADAPGLMGQAMDDPARGRSPADRLGDEWHANWPVTRETLKYVENAPADSTGKRGIDTVLRSTDPDARRAFTRAWFGFEVAANGEVTLPLARAQVVGIDAIGVLDGSHPPSNGVRETIHLAGEQLNALTGAGHRNRVLALEAFQDHRARKLRLRLTAISRHAPHFRWLAPRKDQKLGWLPAEDEYQPADQTSLSAEAASTAEVWVKASRRPDPPAAREVSLVFEVREIPSTTVDTAKGKTPIREGCREWRGVARLRIELDRPWFSSGEGERLGSSSGRPAVSQGSTNVWPPARCRAIRSGRIWPISSTSPISTMPISATGVRSSAGLAPIRSATCRRASSPESLGGMACRSPPSARFLPRPCSVISSRRTGRPIGSGRKGWTMWRCPLLLSRPTRTARSPPPRRRHCLSRSSPTSRASISVAKNGLSTSRLMPGRIPIHSCVWGLSAIRRKRCLDSNARAQWFDGRRFRLRDKSASNGRSAGPLRRRHSLICRFRSIRPSDVVSVATERPCRSPTLKVDSVWPSIFANKLGPDEWKRSSPSVPTERYLNLNASLTRFRR